MNKTMNTFSADVPERAVRPVLDNQDQHGSRRQTVLSISSKIGCAPQTLNERDKHGVEPICEVLADRPFHLL